MSTENGNLTVILILNIHYYNKYIILIVDKSSEIMIIPIGTYEYFEYLFN